MSSDRCLSCQSCLSVCLSVTFVRCGQTVARIKMKSGMEVGLGSMATLYQMGTQLSLPQRGTALNVRPMSVVAKPPDGSRCRLVGE